MRSALLMVGLVGFLSACAATRTEAASPETPVRVATVFEDGVTGHEAVLRLPAQPIEIERWLLDFERGAADRPNVMEAKLVERTADAWVARFRFRGPLGIHPTAVTRTTRRREGEAVVLSFASVETSFGLTRLFGSYRLEPMPGGATRLTHRLFVVSPFATESRRETDMREDAAAILRRWAPPDQPPR
jgi:hypothetical protein